MLYLFHWNFWTQNNNYIIGVCGIPANTVDAKAHDLCRLSVNDSLKSIRTEGNRKPRHKTQTLWRKNFCDVRKLFQHKLSKTAQIFQQKKINKNLVHQWYDGKFKEGILQQPGRKIAESHSKTSMKHMLRSPRQLKSMWPWELLSWGSYRSEAILIIWCVKLKFFSTYSYITIVALIEGSQSPILAATQGSMSG